MKRAFITPVGTDSDFQELIHTHTVEDATSPVAAGLATSRHQFPTLQCRNTSLQPRCHSAWKREWARCMYLTNKPYYGMSSLVVVEHLGLLSSCLAWASRFVCALKQSLCFSEETLAEYPDLLMMYFPHTLPLFMLFLSLRDSSQMLSAV